MGNRRTSGDQPHRLRASKHRPLTHSPAFEGGPPLAPKGDNRRCLRRLWASECHLAGYASALSLPGVEEGLLALAEAVAADPSLRSFAVDKIVVRTGFAPTMAVLGRFDPDSGQRFSDLASRWSRMCERLRYIGYREAEKGCELLAADLVERLGTAGLASWRFAAIPRGGFVVLGMLAPMLGIDASQCEAPASSRAPLVLVDDCALTGARIGRYLAQSDSPEVVVAVLCSHPDLRHAVMAAEPRVRACISAYDLRDHGPRDQGPAYGEWQARWLRRLPPPRYWVGRLDHVCFPWNEPDWTHADATGNGVERGWRVVPPSQCYKNRPRPGQTPIPIEIQVAGAWPLRPSARAIFTASGDEILVGDLQTGESFSLAGVAADIWRAIVECGTLDGVVSRLLAQYEVAESVVRDDASAFVTEMLKRGLIEEGTVVA